MPEPPTKVDKDFDENNAPPIVLNLYDKNFNILNLDGDDFLGRAVIKLSDASLVRSMYDDQANCNQIPQPKWHNIKAGFGVSSPTCG